MKLLSYWKQPVRAGIFLFCLCLYGQRGEIIPLTPAIGYTLDAAENLHYEVFTDIPGFESAQFFEINPNRIEARIVFVEFSRRKASRRAYSLRQWSDLQLRVMGIPALSDEERSRIGKNLTYLRTNEILASIPVGQYVNIKHRSGKRIKGTLLSYGDRSLTIQTPVSVEQIKIWEMERITYREKIIQRPTWKLGMYGVAGVLGLLMMEVWNRQTSPRAEMVWNNRFMGAIYGTLVGGEVYDTIMILTSPRSQYGLTQAEMEKLKR
ncbi:MAG: hypothetical protein ACE5D2_00495 [Fidelibacterota bacterium]